jgi:hypothetical protein
MSRTDKTRPFWVKVEDPYNRRYVEEDHDHRSSDCDFDGTSAWYSRSSIPRLPSEAAKAFWRAERERCVIRPVASYGGFGEFSARKCGSWCQICGPDMGHKGRQRGRWRSLARKIVKTPTAEIDDLVELTTSACFIRRERGAHW